MRFWRGSINLLDKDIEAVLTERDPSLKEMYVGAHAVLKDSKNPEFIIQSAHSFRELIEKLPSITDEVYEEIKGGRQKFDQRLKNALDRWEYTPFKSLDDLKEQKIMDAVDTLNTLKEERDMIPTRRAEFNKFIEHEYSQHYRPSENYLRQVYNKRKELYNFFVSVCHHQKEVTIDQFIEKIDELNSLLRSLLIKTPTSDTNELDRILDD